MQIKNKQNSPTKWFSIIGSGHGSSSAHNSTPYFCSAQWNRLRYLFWRNLIGEKCKLSPFVAGGTSIVKPIRQCRYGVFGGRGGEFAVCSHRPQSASNHRPSTPQYINHYRLRDLHLMTRDTRYAILTREKDEYRPYRRGQLMWRKNKLLRLKSV